MGSARTSDPWTCSIVGKSMTKGSIIPNRADHFVVDKLSCMRLSEELSGLSCAILVECWLGKTVLIACRSSAFLTAFVSLRSTADHLSVQTTENDFRAAKLTAIVDQ